MKAVYFLLAAAAAVALLFAWQYLLAVGVGLLGLRVAFRRVFPRQRPRESWARNAEAASLVYAAWNTRKLGRRPR